MNYDTLQAESGEKAIDVAISEGPDLILMTIKLPTMTGIEATIKLKQNPKTSSIPVIVQSDQPVHKTDAIKAGATGFLLKPTSAEDLKIAIGDVFKPKP